MKIFSRIFSMLVAAFAFSVLFCAPTFAEESLSISVDGVAEVEATPNTLETGTVDVYVSSSSRDGYKLSISDSDENNALVSNHGDSINPLAESVTADNFTTNAWGVKVGDNFLPVPKLTDNVLELVNTTKAATNEKHTVTFGMKVDGTAVSGAYSSEVVFTAVANPLVARRTTLKTGRQVNAAWKTLANNSSTTYIATDNKITSVQKFTGDFTDALRSVAQDIATVDSDWPVYTWFDNGTIYYYTEADEVFFNADSSFMFYAMRELASIDFNFGLETDVDPDGDGFIASVQDPVYITSEITNMNSMFAGASALTSLDASNWDTSSVTSMSSMFRDVSSLTSLDISNWDTSKATNMGSMFNGASRLTSLDVSHWDTSKVTNMNSMFYSASALTALDASNWDTSSVTDMRTMFASTSSLTSLDASNWDTSKVTNMSSMFNGASSLISLDVPNWDTSKVTNMNSMFYSASALTALDASNWDTSSVADMGSMFGGVSALTSLDVSNWDTSSVTNMGGMFNGARSLTALDVSNWDTSKVTNMSNMFYKTSALTSLDVSNWDTSKVTNMGTMFSSASSLTSLDVSNWDTSKVIDMGAMFRNTSSLTSLDISNWDTSKVTNMNDMFYNASALTSLDVSNWDTSKVTDMHYMFSNTSALTTIYASDKFNTNAVTNSTYMFAGASRLVGGNGTVYDTGHTDKEYARIDKPGTPGYFSEKIVVRKATLNQGSQVNATWKSLAKGDVAAWNDVDNSITSIQKYTGEFTDAIQANAIDIAISNSDCPVWTWFNNGTIYYYTEADEVFLNSYSNNMFNKLQNLVSIDLNFGLATDVDPDGDGFIANRKDPVYITSNVIEMSSMFYGDNSLAVLDVSRWDTSKVTGMQSMFSSNSSLVTLDVSGWDTSKVTTMYNMFGACKSLVTLDVSGWDTSKVRDMSYLFPAMYSLTSLDVSKWDTSSVTKMGNMFTNSRSLTVLDLSGWDTSKVTSMSSMFGGTDSLTTIYASDLFKTDAVTSSSGMFSSAINLVGGNGTAYDVNHKDKEYARIDKPGTPGYFTAKPAGN